MSSRSVESVEGCGWLGWIDPSSPRSKSLTDWSKHTHSRNSLASSGCKTDRLVPGIRLGWKRAGECELVQATTRSRGVSE